MIQTELKIDQCTQANQPDVNVLVQTDQNSPEKPKKAKFDIQSSKLFRIFTRYYGQFDDFSDMVYKDFTTYNILSPHDVYKALSRVKIILSRHEKHQNTAKTDRKFIIGYYEISMKTLDYLMSICNLTDYYDKVRTHYNDITLDNSIKALVRVK